MFSSFAKGQTRAALGDARGSPPAYLRASEQDGLAGGFLLHVRGEALEELGVLPLGHRPEHRGRGPASRVHCTQSSQSPGLKKKRLNLALPSLTLLDFQAVIYVYTRIRLKIYFQILDCISETTC